MSADYVHVSFEVHREDFAKGLTVRFLEVPGDGLVPFVEGPRKAAVHVEREGDTVDVTMCGGTLQQFDHHRRQQAEYAKRHGLIQGEHLHLPRHGRDAA